MKVRFAYYLDPNPFNVALLRVLVAVRDNGEIGLVFFPQYGWTNVDADGCRSLLRMLPGVREKPNWGEDRGVSWRDTNKNDPAWQWCYEFKDICGRANFTHGPTRVSRQEDDSVLLTAY